MDELVDVVGLQRMLTNNTFAPWVRQLGLQVREARAGEVLVVLPVTAPHLHNGGTLCGQALMAAADTAMALAVTTRFGTRRTRSTLQLQTSFLRPIREDAGEVIVTARVQRVGATLAHGEVEVAAADGRLAAHVTTTCVMQ